MACLNRAKGNAMDRFSLATAHESMCGNYAASVVRCPNPSFPSVNVLSGNGIWKHG